MYPWQNPQSLVAFFVRVVVNILHVGAGVGPLVYVPDVSFFANQSESENIQLNKN